jgi:LysM repeat protein
MGQTYTIKQGDHLSGIAQQFGFTDFQIIWSHGNNQDLKKRRKDPHVLYPGDQLFIPDKELKTETRPTTKVHVFQTTDTPLLLKIVLKDFDNKPLPNIACELEVDGQVQKLTSDGDGLVKTNVKKTAKAGVLRVSDLDLEIPVQIGFLDPVEEASGQRARLINLGYLPGVVQDGESELLHDAIEEFQCDHGLKVDGICGPATQAKLKEIHGS